MNYAVLVTANPQHENAWHAIRFCQSAIAAGHHIQRVFFYGEGVLVANALQSPPQGSLNLLSLWQELSTQNIELIVCVAAALKRGVPDADNAKRMELKAHTIDEVFSISGLGQLTEAMIEADRFISFPG